MSAQNQFITVNMPDELMTILALEWIIRNVGNDGTFAFDAPGLAQGLLKMRSLSPSDLRKVAHHARDCFSVRFDRDKFAKAIYSASADSQKADNLNFLLNNGATRGMISDILGVTDSRIDRARDLLGQITAPRGRPSMPGVFEREQIHQAWAETSTLAHVERFRRLKERFPRWTLASLYATVNEFSRDPARESNAQRASTQASF